MKKNNIPENKWFEDRVNTENDHIKITYGEDPKIVALVAPVSKREFKVQFLLNQNTPNIQSQKVIEEVKQELDFFLVELGERKPWEYAIYHCSTAANIYSKVHWSYYPKSIQT